MKKKVMLILSCLFLSIGLVSAQTKATGIVVDGNGEPLVSVTVAIKGTTTGAITDYDGKFSLTVPEMGTMLSFYLVGMRPMEMPAASSMRAVMEENEELLDEVIVVAYGTAKKSAYTGAAGVVKSKDITKLQVSSVTKALEGTVPGLQVSSSGGQPGSDATLRIRGYGSMAAGNSPLIVLDGTVFDGNLNSINSQDIESISVLKDATSAALYGSRAANGVVMITTKQGRKGKAKVTLDIKQGVNVRGISEYNIMKDPGQYLETYWTALYHSDKYKEDGEDYPGASALYATQNLYGKLGYNPYMNVANDQIVGIDGKLSPGLVRRYTDNWKDEAFKTGYRQEYNLTVGSGNESLTSFLSLGYLDDSGIVDGTGFKRYSIRENLTYALTKNLNLSANVAYARTTQDQILSATSTGAAANMFNFVTNIAPIYPVYMYDLDGKRMRDNFGNVMYDYGVGKMPGTRSREYAQNTNPIGAAYNDRNKTIDDNFNGRGSLDYSFLDGFKATVNFGYDLRNNVVDVFYNPRFGDAQNVNGRVQKRGRRYESITSNQLLNYTKTISDIHTIAVLAGHESYQYRRRMMFAQKENVFLPGVDEFDNALLMTGMESNQVKKTLDSYLSQVLYDYDDRYYFSASFRRDGSSIFHKDNRWGNFWSVGGSWRITNEQFMKPYEWVDNLRLRTSYGVQGNDAILTREGDPIYKPYIDQFNLENNDGDPALVRTYVGNKDLKWEINKNFNVGLDLALFNNRLNLEFDYFVRKSSDLLYNRPLPDSDAKPYQPENVGSTKNTGIEFTLSGDVIRTKDFRWNLMLLGTHVTNKITSVPTKQIINGSSIWKKGGSIYDYFLLEYAGVDSDTGYSMWYYNDSTTGEKVTTTDPTEAMNNDGRKQFGSPIPDFSGAFNMTFEYKGFDLSVMTNFQIGGKLLDSNYVTLMHGGNSGTNWHKDILKAWTETNKNTNVPILNSTYQDGNYERSSRFLIGADYLSLRNLTIGYTFAPKVLKSMKLDALRVSLSGDNLALWSQRKGLDPRQVLSSGADGKSQVQGETDYGYTPIRSYSLGLSVNF